MKKKGIKIMEKHKINAQHHQQIRPIHTEANGSTQPLHTE